MRLFPSLLFALLAAISSPAATPAINWTPVKSSNIKHVAYDPDSLTMHVQFTSGKVYQYADFAPEEFDAFIKAESQGKHFARHIKPRYATPRELSTPEPEAPPPLLSPESPESATVATNAPDTAQGPAGSAQAPEAPGSEKPGGAVQSESGTGGTPGPGETKVPIPGTSKSYPARYALRELSDVQASHSGETFAKNKSYQLTNDRDYNQLENRGKVLDWSLPKNFDPAYLISDNRAATDGPPVIDSQGNVLGGNGRTMILDRVYGTNPKGAAEYKAMLAQKAQQFGIDPAQLEGMKRPILVREVADEHLGGSAGKQAAVTEFNQSGTAALKPSERAIADSRRVSQETLDHIAGKLEAGGPDASLAKVLEGDTGAQLLNRMVEDGVINPQDKAAYVHQGALTPEGKTRISKLLLGRFFRDPAQLDTIQASVRNKLERIAAPLARVEGQADWTLTPKVQEALDLLEAAKGYKGTLGDYLKQSGLYGDQNYSAEAVTLAKALQTKGAPALAQAVREYAAAAHYAGQGATLFGDVPTPAGSFAEAFGRAPSAKTKPSSGARPR